MNTSIRAGMERKARIKGMKTDWMQGRHAQKRKETSRKDVRGMTGKRERMREESWMD